MSQNTSKVIHNLFKNFEAGVEKPFTGDKLKVNNVVSAASFVYEKIRNAVDYKEEHLIRKDAIYRILKRKLMLEKVILENYLLDKYHQENIAENLLQELVRGKYVEYVPVVKVAIVDEIIQKYNFLISQVKEYNGKITQRTFNKFLEIAAVEIENELISPIKQKALARAMFSVFNPKIKLETENIDKKEKELQLYLGCFRTLYHWDDAMLSFMLLTMYYPSWLKNDEAIISKIAKNINNVEIEITKQLQHPWRKQVSKILNKKAMDYWLLEDIWEANKSNPEQVFADFEELEAEIQKAANKRYKGVGARLRRGVVRSIIYVFFTKMLLALALEFPADYYLNGEVNYNTAAINILFPPVIMFIVAIMIRMPRKENTKQLIKDIKDIAYNLPSKKQYVLKEPKQRGKFARGVFSFVYIVSFVFSLSVIFWILNKFEFNGFSSLIYLLFLTLVSFFGIRIRKPVKELLVIDKKDNILGAIFDFFSLPFVSMGKLMSEKFSKMNVFAFFLDFIIEAPFKLLIEVIEDLFSYLREKKEDVMTE